MHIFEQNNIVDIWRIRNPILKQYTFRKSHFSGFIQRRLDYIFISNSIKAFYYPFVVTILLSLLL